MNLRVGDCLVDESGKWQALARPYTTAGGKTVNVRVQRVITARLDPIAGTNAST